MLGRRPTASSTCEPTTSGSPEVQSTTTATRRPLRLEADAGGAGAHRDPSLDEDAADGLGHLLVLAGDQARPISTTVTSAPKRRYIWANSRPM